MAEAQAMRALWLAREQPFPLDTGDRIYTAELAHSLARAGVRVSFAGFAPPGAALPPPDWPIEWITVPGARRPTWRALLSTMPVVGGVHATPAYRALVRELAQQEWDLVVVDQYGMGWVLPLIERAFQGRRAPVLVHVAHDHEASVSGQVYREFRGSPLKRIALWQNHLKTRRFEGRTARGVDLLAAITEEDAERFAADAPGVPAVVLTPGYGGRVAPQIQRSARTPRRVVMVGSFHWTAKQENLRRFVETAEAAFEAAGIELHVAGSMPPALADELRSRFRCVRILGFVDDILAEFAQARFAVVPELIGGGFKLKFLDYVFGRVPVATLGHAAAGLPPALRAQMLCADDLGALVDAIVRHIDDLPRLDAWQQGALDAASTLFRWDDRGIALRDAVLQRRAAPEDTMSATSVAVGLCTYKRLRGLERLLEHIAAAAAPLARRPVVIVVDNDGQDPAVGRSVAEFAARSGLSVRYLVETQPGISAARNAIFGEAERLGVRFMAMIDDDEWPSPQWLGELLAAQRKHGAAVIGGPVRPVFPDSAKRLRKYARYWSVVKQSLNGKPFVFCSCNFLIDMHAIRGVPRPLFDEAFGLSGGGDTVFFRRLFFAGHPMQWSDEAIVYEEVPPSRASFAWMRQRRFRSGNHAVLWERLSGGTAKTLLKTLALSARLAVYPLLGREPDSPFVGWLLEFDKVRGRHAAHFGGVFVEYARPQPPGGKACG